MVLYYHDYQTARDWIIVGGQIPCYQIILLLFGYDIARLYVKTVLPILCIIIYLIWLSKSHEQKS